jgi:ABC-type sugar transport system substrate-binding protein
MGRDLVGGSETSETPERGSTRSGFFKRVAASGVAVGGVSSILAACGGGGKDAGAVTATTSTDSGTGTAPAGAIADKYKNLTIGVPIYTLLDENQATLVQYLKEASDRAGLKWKFLTDDTKADQAAAQSAVQSYVTRKVDAIIDLVIPAAFIEAQLAAAKTAGIPVVGTYTFADFASSVAADYAAPLDHDGTLMAHYLINDQLHKRNRKTVKIAMLDAPLDVVSPRRWVFEAIAANNKGIEIVEKDFNVSLTDTVSDAAKRAKALVQKHGDLNAIWCNYPPIAVPAASGVAQSGKSDIQVYGHIAQSAGVEAVRDKSNPMVATSWFDLAYNSYGLIDLTLAALSGGTPNRQISYIQPIPDSVFGEENVEAEVPKGTKASDWKFGGGTYRDGFVAKWNKSYGS